MLDDADQLGIQGNIAVQTELAVQDMLFRHDSEVLSVPAGAGFPAPWAHDWMKGGCGRRMEIFTNLQCWIFC